MATLGPGLCNGHGPPDELDRPFLPGRLPPGIRQDEIAPVDSSYIVASRLAAVLAVKKLSGAICHARRARTVDSEPVRVVNVDSPLRMQRHGHRRGVV